MTVFAARVAVSASYVVVSAFCVVVSAACVAVFAGYVVGTALRISGTRRVRLLLRANPVWEPVRYSRRDTVSAGDGGDAVDSENTALVRVLGRWDVLVVAFGAMIGFGWVVLTGDFLRDAGAWGSALAFAIGGVVVALIGLTYAELVSAIPKAGGEHNYVLRGMGARAAFATSWLLVLGYITVVAFEAVALPESLSYLIPGLESARLWSVAGSDVYGMWVLVGVVGAVVMTALNYVGVRPAAVFQTIAVLFLCAVGAALLAGAFVGGTTEHLQPAFGTGLGGTIGVLMAVPFLFVGFDVIPQSAEEIKVSSRRVGLILVFSVGCAAAWYILVMLTVGSALPADELGASGLAAAEGMAALWNSSVMGDVLVLGGIAGILTSWNGFVIGVSRLLYAMAQSGMVPAWFGRVHPRFRTPSNAILFVGAFSVVAPFFGSELLTWMVDAGGFAVIVAYTMVALTFLALRRREPELERPFRVPAGRLVGCLAAVCGLGLTTLFLPGMPSGLTTPEWVVVGLWGIFGVVLVRRIPRVRPGPEAEEQLLAAVRQPARSR